MIDDIILILQMRKPSQREVGVMPGCAASMQWDWRPNPGRTSEATRNRPIMLSFEAEEV